MLLGKFTRGNRQIRLVDSINGDIFNLVEPYDVNVAAQAGYPGNNPGGEGGAE